MSLSEASASYRPMQFPWAHDYWLKQQQLHWLALEVKMDTDIRDYNSLSPEMRSVITGITRMFVQADIDVQNCYHSIYQKIFKPVEVQMMLAAFSNAECFDERSELLTSEGWKYCRDITASDRVAQYDIDTSGISFTQPKKVVKYPYKGLMHHYKNKTSDICITPNHDIIVVNPHDKSKRKKVKSESGKWGRNYLYPSAGYGSGDKTDASSMEKVMIALAADGCMRGLCPSALGSRVADISFSKHHKIAMLRWLLNEAGLPFTERDAQHGRTNFCFQVPDEYDLNSIKDLSFIKIEEYSATGAEKVVEEILWWDGTSTGQMAFYSTNQTAVDKFQALCSLSGISSIIGINRSAAQSLGVALPNGKKPKTAKDAYVVTISDLELRTYPHRKEIEYDGYVYCVSVPTQNLVSRRNGKVACTGNTIHIDAYSHLIDSLGLPESEYTEFLSIKEMRDKHDFMRGFDPQDPQSVAETLAAVSAFGEGLSLFASFAVLLNFPRQNLLKGMGQIVSWSVRDESLHCEGVMRLYHTWLAEHPEIDQASLAKRIAEICRQVIQQEDAFTDLVFKAGDVPGLSAQEVKSYIRYIANIRLRQLGQPDIYDVVKNPLPWIDTMQTAPEHVNFFETQATEYSKAATEGTWDNAFG